ncbi:MAG: hypothetical protein RSB13_00545 [Aurantimicrobium sp.]
MDVDILGQEGVEGLLASAFLLRDVSEEDCTKLAFELVCVVCRLVKVAHSLDEHLGQVLDQHRGRVVVWLIQFGLPCRARGPDEFRVILPRDLLVLRTEEPSGAQEGELATT